MLTFDQVGEILDNEVGRLPPEIFEELNGGVVLLPDTVPHPDARGDDLYILGRYIHQPNGLGRYIAIYYGSFVMLYGGSRRSLQEKKLAEVLRHELTHHLESLAGDRSLELEDEEYMDRYKSKYED